MLVCAQLFNASTRVQSQDRRLGVGGWLWICSTRLDWQAASTGGEAENGMLHGWHGQNPLLRVQLQVMGTRLNTYTLRSSHKLVS